MGASVGRSSGGSRLSRKYRGRRFNDINITPMVDVMLVLLIIFMVTAPMLTAGIPVDLPKVKSSPLQGDDNPLEFSIQDDGKIFLQKTPIRVEEIGTKLRAIAGEKTDTRIFIRGSQSVDYGRVMKVVSEVTAAGFTKVALITEPPADSSRAR